MTQQGVALVTGGAKRIGRTLVTALAADGWAVGIHYNRSAHEAEDLAQSLRDGGGRAAAFRADLCAESAVRDLLPAVGRSLGPVTLLINNASTFENDSVADMTRQSWDRHIEANLRAPMVLTQDIAASLPAGSQGNVINILDQRVWNLTPYFLSYTVSKSALWTLTRTLAMALAPRVRVNGIGPGPTLRNERQSEAHFAAQYQAVPLARPTDPSEVAEAVRFILRSPAMTGQMIALDGGEHLGWAQPSRGIVPIE